jgi:hypothetical protein
MASTPSVDYAVLCLTLWLGGATLFFIIQMIRYASMRDELLSEATEIANINGVSVVASDQVAGPLAFGLFKRYIAVPQDFTKSYSAEERELAIAHEMAHHRSGDLFANLAAFILLCLSWFNPVAWLSWSAFRVDQEAACDARVLAGKDTQDRVIYGRVLARTAFDGVPAFATALNSPKTIIERLRRLNMKNASTKRRLFGKIGIIAAAALVLPLTATVVPAVVAQDETVADGKAETVKRDGKTIDIFRHDDGERVTMVERDGTVFIFLTDKKPTRGEVEKMIEEAETSAKEAETSAKEAETYAKETDEAMSEADIAQIEADTAMASAEFGRGMAQANRVIVNAAVDIAKIDIQDMTQNCTAGQYLSTDVKSLDGTRKARVRRVTCGEPCDVCGKRQAKFAMVKALTDLRAARRNIVSATEMPKAVRKDVMEKLDNEIRELETQTDNIN